MTTAPSRPGDVARALVAAHTEQRNAAIERRLSVEALTRGDAELWRQARNWAKSNPKIAATVNAATTGYLERGGTPPDLPRSTEYLDRVAVGARGRIRSERRDYLRVALEQRGLTLPDDPDAA